MDITACNGGKLCIHSEFRADAVGPGCSRSYLTRNEHETYRVVDLNGQRAVAAVGYIDESINPELMREARAVFESIVFKSGK